MFKNNIDLKSVYHKKDEKKELDSFLNNNKDLSSLQIKSKDVVKKNYDELYYNLLRKIFPSLNSGIEEKDLEKSNDNFLKIKESSEKKEFDSFLLNLGKSKKDNKSLKSRGKKRESKISGKSRLFEARSIKTKP